MLTVFREHNAIEPLRLHDKAGVPLFDAAGIPLYALPYKDYTTFERLGRMQTCISLIWAEQYRGIGKFQIVAVDEPQNARLLRVGNVIWQRGKDVSMRIETVIYDTENTRITARGYTSLDLLGQRVIPNPLNITNAEAGMYQAVSQNLRELPNVELAQSRGYPEVMETALVGGVAAELERVAAQTELGFKMCFDNGGGGGSPRTPKHIFTVYKGVDRTYGNVEGNDPVVFSEERKNLSELTLTDDDSLFANVAYVEAADSDENRRVITVGAADTTGLDRHEMFIRARVRPAKDETLNSPRITQEMTNEGLAELNKRLRIQTFRAMVDPRDFRVKYDLGDLVTCKSERFGITVNTRIMEFQEVKESNKTMLTLTLGEPEFTKYDELRLER